MNSQTIAVSNLTLSSTIVGSIESVSNPTAVTNGYTYTITLKGLTAGSFNISLNASVISDKEGNKNTKTTSSNITVAKVAATNPTLSAYTGVYDGTSHTIGVSGGSGGTIEYSTDNKTWTTTKPTRTNAGTTTVYVRVTGDSNHNTTSAISTKIEISQRSTTCTSSGGSKEYDGTALVNKTGGSCTNLVSGHSATLTNTGSITNVGTTPNTISSVVIKNGTTDVSENYAITKVGGSLTITKTAATNPTLSAYTGVYDGTSHTIGVSGGNGGTIEYSTDNKTWTTTKPTRTDVGTTTVYVRVTGDSNHNTTTAISSTITITRKPISLPTCGSKTYTGASQTLFTSTTEYTAGGTTSGIDAGAYTATATPTGNYMWTDKTTTAKNVTCTINPKSVGVNWGSTTSFTYNGSAQGPSVSSVTGVSGETVNFTRTTAINVGSYTSTASCSSVIGGRAKCGNYTLTGITKAFSIARASMTKPSSPAAKNYTGSSQTSGITCPSGSTTGGTTSATNAGTYSQTCTPDANHKWSDGTTTAASISWTINKINPVLTQSATSGSATTGNTTSYTISSNLTGSYKASSSNANYATVWLSSTSEVAAGTEITSTVKAVSVNSNAITITITFTPSDTTNYNSVSKTYSFTPLAITRTSTFYANGNTLSTPSGCSASGNDRVCSCKTTGTATSCSVTAPTITAPSATPSIIGFSTSSTNRTNSVSNGGTVTLSSNPSYYAQTYKSAVTHTITWNANGATIGSTASSCSIGATYNGTAQASGCSITSPTITRSGYTIYGWNTSSSASTSSWNVGVSKTVSVSATYYAITKDTTAPKCGNWSGESTTWTSNNRTISVGCSDSGSGCKSSTFSKTFSSNTKTANVSITISDKAGNTATCTKNSANIYVGKTANIVYQTYNGASTDTSISTVAAGYGPKVTSNGGLSGRVNKASPIFKIYVSGSATNISGGVNYQVYQQTYGTSKTVANGTWYGTDGKRIEAIKIWLTGDMANAFDIYYRVYVQGQGWLVNGTANGQWTGSQGLCKKIEAIEIGIYPKGVSDLTPLGWDKGGIDITNGGTFLTDQVYTSCK